MAGLGLIYPKEVLSTLMCKWMLLALEPSDSNLKTLLHFKLAKWMPSWHRRWIPTSIGPWLRVMCPHQALKYGGK